VIFSLDDLTNPSSDRLIKPGLTVGDVFQGRVGDAFSWTSNMPELSVFGRFASDPALRSQIQGNSYGSYAGAPSLPMQSFLGQLSVYNVAGAMRINLGRVASTVGLVLPDIAKVADFYREPLEAVAAALNIVEEVWNAEWFQSALNALGFVPVVGWIVLAVIKVSQIVLDVIDYVQDASLNETRKKLAQRAIVPMSEWSADADEVLAKRMMASIMADDLQWCFMPRYEARDPSDFRSNPIVVPERNPVYTEGYLLYTADPTPDTATGLGLIPGTRNLHASMELYTRGGASFKDVGDYYPTAKMAAVQLWEMIVAGGPGLFAIDAEQIRDAWMDYAYAALRFTRESFDCSWSLNPAGYGIGDCTFKCDPEYLEGAYGHHDGKGKHCGQPGTKNKTFTVRGDGHQAVLSDYLFALFDYKRENTSKGWDTDNIDFARITPAVTCDEVLRRQLDVLKTHEAMYVNASEGGTGQPRFRAIGTHDRRGPLYDDWRETVSFIIQSRGDWETIRFNDMPPGDLKETLRLVAEDAGLNPETDLPISPAQRLAVPGMQGSATPPPLPDPIEVDIEDEVDLPKRKGKKASNAGMGLALGALGLLGAGLVLK